MTAKRRAVSKTSPASKRSSPVKRKNSPKSKVVTPTVIPPTQMIRLLPGELLSRAYEGASKGKRTKNWRTSNTSANWETLVGLDTLRARCRDLVRNNGHATNAIRILTSHTVGTGIIAKIEAKTENQTSKLRELWAAWAETLECDADGLHDIYGLMALAARSMFESGEVLIRRRWRRASDKLTIPMQLQILEADFIDTTKNQEIETGFIVQGVEYNKLGKRVAYWLFPQHPGDASFAMTMQSKRVPVEDIIHLYLVERPGQVRGIPRGAPVIIKTRDLDEYLDSSLNAAKVASCFTVFVTESDMADAPTDDDEDSDLPTKIEPAMITKLAPGQQIQIASPPAAGGLVDFSQISLRAIAVGYGVPPEAMTGDYSEMNFSSSRMSLNYFERELEMVRWLVFVPRVCKRLFAWFLEGAEIQGVKTTGAASVWTPPRRQMIDPLNETRAMREAVRAGFMSLYEAIRQLGYDPKEVLEEAAEAKKFLEEKGLVFDTDASKVTQYGMNQPEFSGSGGEGDGSDQK